MLVSSDQMRLALKVMKQAASRKGFFSDLLLPGIRINTSPNDFLSIEQMQLSKFNGVSYSGISGSTSEASWVSDCCQPR